MNGWAQQRKKRYSSRTGVKLVLCWQLGPINIIHQFLVSYKVITLYGLTKGGCLFLTWSLGEEGGAPAVAGGADGGDEHAPRAVGLLAVEPAGGVAQLARQELVLGGRGLELLGQSVLREHLPVILHLPGVRRPAPRPPRHEPTKPENSEVDVVKTSYKIV